MLQLGSKTFWRNVNPSGAAADFVAVFREAGRNRWRIAALAALTTYGVFSLVIHEEARVVPKPPQIIYITSFAPGRSDAEILAEDRANQKRKDRLAAEQLQRDEMVRGIYKSIGRVSGLDVNAIERQGRVDQAAEDKATAAKLAALYGAARVTTPAASASAHP